MENSANNTFEELRGSLPQPKKQPVARYKPPRGRAKRSLIPPHLDIVCQEGARTNQLTKVAGYLIMQKHPISVVNNIALDWNERNDPPLEEEKVVSTCKSIMLTHQHNHPEDFEYGSGDECLPLFDPETARVTRFLSTEAPVRCYLLRGFLPAGIVGGIVARGGSSKTQLLLQLGVSIASGQPLCGHWEVDQTGGVLMLLAEDDDDEIHRRLQVIVRQLAISGNTIALEQIEKNLYIRSMVGEDNLMTTTNAYGEVEPTDYVDRLIETAMLFGPLRAIVIDPVSRFRGGEENSNEDATRFIQALECIRKGTGATVLVAHHANKGSMTGNEQSSSAARGASAFSDGIRWQMNLASPTPAEVKAFGIPAATKHEYVVASVTKSNYTPPTASIVLKRGEGGYLTAHSHEELRANKEELALTALLRLIEANEPMAARKIEEKFGGEDGPLKLGQNRVRELIKTGLTQGYLSGTSRKPVRTTERGTAFVKTIAERIPDDAIVPRAKLSPHKTND